MGPKLEANSRRLERPAADHVLQRVIPEQRQMSGAAAWRDAGLDRNAEPRHAATRQHIEARAYCAASSSVSPPDSNGKPPSPSATTMTIFELLRVCRLRVSWCMSMLGSSIQSCSIAR